MPFFKKQEKTTKKDIEETIRKDKYLMAKVENITAINGVGLISVATILVSCHACSDAPSLALSRFYFMIKR